MPTEARNDNGKVTLAVLATKLDIVIETVKETNTTLTKHFEESARRDTRISLLELTTSSSCKELERLDTKVDDVKRRTYWWEGINSALVVLAGYLGIKT